MNIHHASQHRLFKGLVGGVAVALGGLMLWQSPHGESWANASYDYLFRFGARPITNKVAIVLMDNAAYAALGQERGRSWDRTRHAELLNKLGADQCSLVVLDVFFRNPGKSETDDFLASAIRKLERVVLMAEANEPEHQLTESKHSSMQGLQLELPHKRFLEATTNWGIGKASANLGGTPRRHWPFPAPTSFPSLPWAAARLTGAALPEKPTEQWLRYYGADGPWASFSYHLAMAKPAGYFRDTIVFIGNDPESEDPTLSERDKFATPYTRWNGRAVGGVKIMATTFLNLVNSEWLRRPASWVETLVLLISGLVLGAIPFLARPLATFGIAILIAALAMLGTILICYFGSVWFPWLIVAGGQAPCAVALAVARSQRLWARREQSARSETVVVPVGAVLPRADEVLPEAPDYQFFGAPFGAGAFGKVWLVRNAIGQWQALKAVYQAKFGDNQKPYDMEFNGIQQYKPISEQHLGLLRVDFISQKRPKGYFYYVMELGDACVSGWEENPETYRPKDLAWFRSQAAKQRLPVRECVSIGLSLADALAFLHSNGLTHRDVKPSNIIFVCGKPKLADVGLVTRARPPEEITTYAGTPDYMPPRPEPPGTPQADIFALGMLLYVISTGREPAYFPELKTTLIMDEQNIEFMLLNPIILRACNPDVAERYASTAELLAALQSAQRQLSKHYGSD